jgi:hypothetical protein
LPSGYCALRWPPSWRYESSNFREFPSRRCLIVAFVILFLTPIFLTTATRCSQKRRCHCNYTQPKETPTAQIRHPTLFTQALPSLVTCPPILTVRCSARGHGGRAGAIGTSDKVSEVEGSGASRSLWERTGARSRLEGILGPIGLVLCRMLQMDFREHLF